MVSVNTNMSYTQTTAGVKETFLRVSVALVTLGLLCAFPRLHSDKPYSVESLSSRDRPVPEISSWKHTTLTRHTFKPRPDSNTQTQQASGLRPSP